MVAEADAGLMDRRYEATFAAWAFAGYFPFKISAGSMLLLFSMILDKYLNEAWCSHGRFKGSAPSRV